MKKKIGEGEESKMTNVNGKNYLKNVAELHREMIENLQEMILLETSQKGLDGPRNLNLYRGFTLTNYSSALEGINFAAKNGYLSGGVNEEHVWEVNFSDFMDWTVNKYSLKIEREKTLQEEFDWGRITEIAERMGHSPGYCFNHIEAAAGTNRRSLGESSLGEINNRDLLKVYRTFSPESGEFGRPRFKRIGKVGAKILEEYLHSIKLITGKPWQKWAESRRGYL